MNLGQQVRRGRSARGRLAVMTDNRLDEIRVTEATCTRVEAHRLRRRGSQIIRS